MERGVLFLSFFIATIATLAVGLCKALLNASLLTSLVIGTAVLLMLHDLLLLSSAASTNFTAYSGGVATWINGQATPEGNVNRAWLAGTVAAINLLSYGVHRAAGAVIRRLAARFVACGSRA
jgi:hypothetical protein